VATSGYGVRSEQGIDWVITGGIVVGLVAVRVELVHVALRTRFKILVDRGRNW